MLGLEPGASDVLEPALYPLSHNPSSHLCLNFLLSLWLSPALESKCKSGEKKMDSVLKEKRRLEAELEAVSRKTHDASGQLVHISQELLRKER